MERGNGDEGVLVMRRASALIDAIRLTGASSRQWQPLERVIAVMTEHLRAGIARACANDLERAWVCLHEAEALLVGMTFANGAHFDQCGVVLPMIVEVKHLLLSLLRAMKEARP